MIHCTRSTLSNLLCITVMVRSPCCDPSPLISTGTLRDAEASPASRILDHTLHVVGCETRTSGPLTMARKYIIFEEINKPGFADNWFLVGWSVPCLVPAMAKYPALIANHGPGTNATFILRTAAGVVPERQCARTSAFHRIACDGHGRQYFLIRLERF